MSSSLNVGSGVGSGDGDDALERAAAFCALRRATRSFLARRDLMTSGVDSGDECRVEEEELSSSDKVDLRRPLPLRFRFDFPFGFDGGDGRRELVRVVWWEGF